MQADPKQPNASAAAQAESTRFADLFELAPMAYLSLGADRIVRLANRAVADLLGCERERLQGADFRQMVDGDFRDEFDGALRKLFATGVAQTLYLQLSRESPPRACVSLTASLGGAEGECLVAMTEIGARQLAAEDQLLALKERHRSLNRMSQNFFWTSDAEHRIKKMSLISRDTGKAYLRYAPTVGMRRWEAPYLSPGVGAWAEHRATLDARLPFRNFELSRLGLDGAEYFFAISGDPLFDASGAFIGYHGLGRDITERKIAEKVLRESEERYRNLFAKAGEGILILSSDGRIVAANEAFARMHGYTVEEILALSITDLLVPEALQLAPDRWRRILGGETLTREVDHCRKDGSVFTVEVSNSRISLGDAVYMQSFHRDVTERKQAEKRLRDSEERYRSLFANAADGIHILSAGGKTIDANEAFARMHGYTRQEILNPSTEQFAQQLLSEKTRAMVPARRARILAGETILEESEHRHRDGHLFPVEISGSLIAWGDETYMQFINRDITDRKRVQTALLEANRVAEAANRAKTRFLAAASHDLRQPAQAINLFLDALAQSGPSEEQKEILHYLGLSVRGLRELLNVLLDISQLDAGVVKPEAGPVSAQWLLRDIESEFAPIVSEKNLRMQRYAGRDLTLLADAGLLLRALRNLVGNAVKYTERGGILLAARRRGAHAVLQVWDTGIGIAPEHIGHLAEEYFQIGNHARDRTKGLGLGLSIVDRLVKLIDGKLVCRSRPGRGTLFEIRLPLAGAAPKDPASRLPPSAAGAGAAAAGAAAILRFAGQRVVVVEDDRLVAKSIEQALGVLGASVATFDSAEAALAGDAGAGAALYISDYRLPGAMNGMQLLAEIERRSGEPIKAVLITGDTALNQAALSAASSWKVLFKPIDMSALLAVI